MSAGDGRVSSESEGFAKRLNFWKSLDPPKQNSVHHAEANHRLSPSLQALAKSAIVSSNPATNSKNEGNVFKKPEPEPLHFAKFSGNTSSRARHETEESIKTQAPKFSVKSPSAVLKSLSEAYLTDHDTVKMKAGNPQAVIQQPNDKVDQKKPETRVTKTSVNQIPRNNSSVLTSLKKLQNSLESDSSNTDESLASPPSKLISSLSKLLDDKTNVERRSSGNLSVPVSKSPLASSLKTSKSTVKKSVRWSVDQDSEKPMVSPPKNSKVTAKSALALLSALTDVPQQENITHQAPFDAKLVSRKVSDVSTSPELSRKISDVNALGASSKLLMNDKNLVGQASLSKRNSGSSISTESSKTSTVAPTPRLSSSAFPTSTTASLGSPLKSRENPSPENISRNISQPPASAIRRISSSSIVDGSTRLSTTSNRLSNASSDWSESDTSTGRFSGSDKFSSIKRHMLDTDVAILVGELYDQEDLTDLNHIESSESSSSNFVNRKPSLERRNSSIRRVIKRSSEENSSLINSRRPSAVKNLISAFSNPKEETITTEIALGLSENAALQELVSSERSYVNALDVLVNKFARPLKTSDKNGCTAQQSALMFSNVEILYSFHKKFVVELEASVEKERVGEIFLKYADFFKMYTQYLNSYEKSMGEINKCSGNKAFRSFIDSVRKDPAVKLDLMSYLIMPVQRIPRYELLIRELIKSIESEIQEAKKEEEERNSGIPPFLRQLSAGKLSSASSHPSLNPFAGLEAEVLTLQQALEKVKEVAEFVNDCKRRMENMSRVLAIQNKIQSDMPMKLLAPHRRLVREGIMEVVRVNRFVSAVKSVRKRICFLFNDSILLLSETHHLKQWHLLSEMEISAVPVLDKDIVGQGSFWGLQILLHGKNSEVYLLRSSDERDDWVNLIQMTTSAYLEVIGAVSERKRLKQAGALDRKTLKHLHQLTASRKKLVNRQSSKAKIRPRIDSLFTS